jgi:hypothetical protein
MKENMYSKWDLLQSILLFILSCLCSFLEHAEQILLYLLYFNDDHERLAIICPPLNVAHAYPHLITGFDEKSPPGPRNDHDQIDEPHEAQAVVSSPVLSPTSPKAQHRYIPLKLPQALHDFPPNHYEYLPVFDGESDAITAEKHIQGFEHFIDLFEIDHDDVCMRDFSQSLRGDTKDWFKHLHPGTISSWEELKDVFLKFWGNKKSLDLQLAEFYALERHGNETIYVFSRRFSSIYYNLSEEIQPSEAAAMLHYTTTLHPDLSFLLMERKPKSLKQMFDDAQDVQHHIQAYEQTRDKELEDEYKQEIVDWKLEHKIENIIGSIEFPNTSDLVKNRIPLVGRRGISSVSNPSQSKQEVDYFMYSFMDRQEDECTNQFVKEQVDIPNLFLLDDLPVYDQYEDDYDIKDVLFYRDVDQPEESIESVEGESLPLCFVAFKLLKENPRIIIETNEFMLMQDLDKPMDQIGKVLKHSSHVFGNPIAYYIKDSISSEVQPSVEDKIEDEQVQKYAQGQNEGDIKTDETTLPLCFASFKSLKKNICKVSSQESSRHKDRYKERSRLARKDNHMDDHIEDCVSSGLQSMFSYQSEKEEEVAPEIVVQGHFISPETNMGIQHDKVFQSCLSSPENDVVVKFLNNIDTDGGFKKVTMETLDCEIMQGDYEKELISIHSFESQNDSPQANFQNFNEAKSELFDEQEDAHNMAVTFEDVREYMDAFVEMHGKVDKPIVAISFENVLKTEEMIFHGFQDPMAILLQSSVKEKSISFISSSFGFNLCFQLAYFTFVCLLKKDVIEKNREANYLIGCIGILSSLD